MSESRKNEMGPRPEAGSSVPGAGDVFATTVKSVSDGIALATKETGKAGPLALEAVTTVVQTSVRGGLGIGGNPTLGAKAIIVGVLHGIGAREAAGLKALSHTSRAVIRITAQLGGDLSASVKGLILGAIASARDLGVDRAQAATSAAQGALEGADEAGSDAAEVVRKALKEDIGGVKVVLPEPIRK